MIAADTSRWIALLGSERGEDAQLVDKALEDQQVLMVSVVLTELLSGPRAIQWGNLPWRPHVGPGKKPLL